MKISRIEIRIDVRPGARPGLYIASLGDRVVCVSRQPLLDACRRLIEEGADPAETAVMVWAATGTTSLTATIAVAGALTVREETRDGVPRFIPYRPYGGPVASPVRSKEQGLTLTTLSSLAA